MRFVEESGDAAEFDTVDQLFVANAHHVHRHLAGDQLRASFLQIPQQLRRFLDDRRRAELAGDTDEAVDG